AIHQYNPSLPIIILSAYSEKEKLLHAIDAGVTKYFIKPFDIDELLEFLCTLAKKMDSSQRVKLLKPYHYDTKHKKLFKDNKIVRLTTREIDLIAYLVDSRSGVITNEKIKEKLSGSKKVSDESVRVFIRRLREKTDKEFIKNLPKQGYMLQTS
ncbi:MAG TPA: response regulator transcription factor, partial [Sulfurovum sp.]|nr:response regulator transcription factor [Sulfurovum sp.]